MNVEPGESPTLLFAIHVEIPDDLDALEVRPSELPRDWHRYPAPEELQAIGTDWASAGASLLLSVPAAVLPDWPELVAAERNYLINPAHSDFRRLRPARELMTLDPRLSPVDLERLRRGS